MFSVYVLITNFDIVASKKYVHNTLHSSSNPEFEIFLKQNFGDFK